MKSKTPTASENLHLAVKLDGWKEIAAYLGRDPRTVQLWEKSEGFPVHRLDHNFRASVYAYSSEIDAWVAARSRQSTAAALEKANAESAQPAKTLRVTAMAAVSVLIVASLGWWLWLEFRQTARLPAPPLTLAVLPFQDQTSSDTSFADGLTYSLIADMGKIGRVEVIAHHSILTFKSSHLPVQQIAAQLHASLVLEGTVARAGDETRVTVELAGMPGDTHIWGATYTRKSAAPDAQERALASQIATDTTRIVAGAAPPVRFAAGSADPRAQQDYLTGRFYWNQRDLPGMERSISLYGQALAIDPKFAAADAGLAESYDLMTDRGVMSNDEAFHRAKAAAESALAIDPSSADAYNGLAFAVYRQDWDFARAEQLFERAVAADPNSAVAHQWYGEFLGDLRRFDESIAQLRKAEELDPLSPMVGCDLADGYLHAGRLSEAEDELRRILELYPDFVPAHQYRITLRTEQGDFEGALKEAKIYGQRIGDEGPAKVAEIRRLVAAGDVKQGRAELHLLLAAKSSSAIAPYSLAQLYFATRQPEPAYRELEEAYREHSWWLVTMLVDPGFDEVRNEPRFLEIANRVGLPLIGLPARPAQAAQSATTAQPG